MYNYIICNYMTINDHNHVYFFTIKLCNFYHMNVNMSIFFNIKLIISIPMNV